MRRFILVGLLSLGLSGCQNTLDSIDVLAFGQFGGLLFGDPKPVELKDVHLDSALLFGKEVMVTGSVLALGNYNTYVIIGDDAARLLVVLIGLGNYRFLEETPLKMNGTKLKIFGRIERGHKGLPYLMAKGINVPS